jgi:hypothetical protein
MVIKMTTEQYHQHIMAQSDDSAKHDALYQAHQRIQQLEKFNAKLTAQVERLRPVISAVESYVDCDQYGWDKTIARQVLITAMTDYRRAMTQLAKDGG